MIIWIYQRIIISFAYGIRITFDSEKKFLITFYVRKSNIVRTYSFVLVSENYVFMDQYIKVLLYGLKILLEYITYGDVEHKTMNVTRTQCDIIDAFHQDLARLVINQACPIKCTLCICDINISYECIPDTSSAENNVRNQTFISKHFLLLMTK